MRKDKYLGPCLNCGIQGGYTGRYFKKMCSRCYWRLRTSGNTVPRTRYTGPCVECGTTIPGGTGYFNKKLCANCYKKVSYRSKNPLEEKSCAGCGKSMIPDKKRIIRDLCSTCRAMKTYYDKHERELSRRRAYRKTSRGRVIDVLHTVRRRSLEKGVESTLTPDQWREILIQYDHRCAYCRKIRKLEIDHVIPLTRNGPFVAENVVPACRKCNASKSNHLLTDWYYGDH